METTGRRIWNLCFDDLHVIHLIIYFSKKGKRGNEKHLLFQIIPIITENNVLLSFLFVFIHELSLSVTI